MADNDDFLRFLASWALVHETADEGWKAAVARGADQQAGEMGSGPDAFVDGLSAMIAERKERLKAEFESGAAEGGASRAQVGDKLDDLTFEVAELRGRLESLQVSLDALLDRTPPAPAAKPAPAPAPAAKPAPAAAPAPEAPDAPDAEAE